MEGLEAPAGFDEAVRQVVEQFGVRRALAKHTEVARRVDDAAAEVMHPDPVHQRAADQRVLTGGQPLRVSEAASGGGQLRVVDGDGGIAEDGEFARGDNLAGLAMVATVMQFALRCGVDRFDEYADAAFDRLLCPQGGGFGTLGDDLVVGGLVVEIQAEGSLRGEVFLNERRLFLGALRDR